MSSFPPPPARSARGKRPPGPPGETPYAAVRASPPPAFDSSAGTGATPLVGMSLMTLATFIFAVQDALTKTLTVSLPVAEIVFVRFAAFLVFALVLAARGPGVSTALRSRVPGRQLLRCLMVCGEIALFAYALRFLGIAEIHALFACFPLVVAALSVPLLGESVGWRRWLAVLVGLVGTLVILRPGSAVFEIYALLPLLCAVVFAMYNLLTRLVSRHDSFATSLLYFGLVGTVASALFAFPQWQPIARSDAWLLAGLCTTSILGHLMLIKALELTAAIVLQPFHYLILPWAMLVGYVVYDETLDAPTLLGAAIVVGSGLYVAYREYVLTQEAG